MTVNGRQRKRMTDGEMEFIVEGKADTGILRFKERTGLPTADVADEVRRVYAQLGMELPVEEPR